MGLQASRLIFERVFKPAFPFLPRQDIVQLLVKAQMSLTRHMSQY